MTQVNYERSLGIHLNLWEGVKGTCFSAKWSLVLFEVIAATIVLSLDQLQTFLLLKAEICWVDYPLDSCKQKKERTQKHYLLVKLRKIQITKFQIFKFQSSFPGFEKVVKYEIKSGVVYTGFCLKP